MTTGKKMSKEQQEKIKKSNRETREKEMQAKQEIIGKIQEEYKDMLLPTLKEKTKEITDLLVDKLEARGDKVNSIEILSIIAKRSLVDVVKGNANSYTPQEIMIAFNLYIQMIDTIQKYRSFPPTVENFCLFLGISRSTYNNWLVDPDKKDAMEYVHSYLLGVLANGGLTGETKEISSMFLQKTMGKVEMQQPIQHEVTVKTDVDDIQAQLQALKRNKIIEGDWEEKDVSSSD